MDPLSFGIYLFNVVKNFILFTWTLVEVATLWMFFYFHLNKY